jgi:hypothetical protein
MRWWSWVARRLRAIDSLTGDAVLAAVVAALAQFARPTAGHRSADVLGAVLLAVFCAALGLRSRGARAVVAAMLAVAVLYVSLGYPQVVLGLPLLIAVYTVGSRHGLLASAGAARAGGAPARRRVRGGSG